MNIHKNAGLTPRSREILISRLERGEHFNDVPAADTRAMAAQYERGRAARPRCGLTPYPIRL